MTSNQNKSLLLTAEYFFYEKSKKLLVEYRKWFEHLISSYYKNSIATIQNWIKETKILFNLMHSTTIVIRKLRIISTLQIQ